MRPSAVLPRIANQKAYRSARSIVRFKSYDALFGWQLSGVYLMFHQKSECFRAQDDGSGSLVRKKKLGILRRQGNLSLQLPRY